MEREKPLTEADEEFLPLLNFPGPYWSSARPVNAELGGTTRETERRAVIAPLWGKTHIPGNLPTSCLWTADSNKAAVLVPD